MPTSQPTLGMNVKFSPEAKAALRRLAAHEQRSQQMVITLMLEPLLLEAARRLDALEAARKLDD